MAEILIVEDDAELAVTLSELLGLDGYATRVAFNGEEALQAIEEHWPDLLLVDIEMPVLDGPGLVAALTAADAGKERIPVILSSGYADLPRVADRLGTPYRVAKPCSMDALRETVELALAAREQAAR